MDMYWAYVLRKDLNEYKNGTHSKNINDPKKYVDKDGKDGKDGKDEIKPFIKQSVCVRCGQNNYFCQCIYLQYFNPEKDIY